MSATTMPVVETHRIIDELLEKWRPELGSDFLSYRNHVYRVFNFSRALAHAAGEDEEKLAIAAAFHDVGIWLDNTFDYLDPSTQHADDYLASIGRAAWAEDIRQMIEQHHKITPWRGPEQNLVEAFRQADWLDVCLLVLPTRLDRPFLAQVLRAFPRAGFHRMLLFQGLRWVWKHPLNPLPIIRW